MVLLTTVPEVWKCVCSINFPGLLCSRSRAGNSGEHCTSCHEEINFDDIINRVLKYIQVLISTAGNPGALKKLQSWSFHIHASNFWQEPQGFVFRVRYQCRAVGNLCPSDFGGAINGWRIETSGNSTAQLCCLEAAFNFRIFSSAISWLGTRKRYERHGGAHLPCYPQELNITEPHSAALLPG